MAAFLPGVCHNGPMASRDDSEVSSGIMAVSSLGMVAAGEGFSAGAPSGEGAISAGGNAAVLDGDAGCGELIAEGDGASSGTSLAIDGGRRDSCERSGLFFYRGKGRRWCDRCPGWLWWGYDHGLFEQQARTISNDEEQEQNGDQGQRIAPGPLGNDSGLRASCRRPVPGRFGRCGGGDR